MSRIRSLHPGLFTDDRYMALSFPARELIKGIWCEADDQGVFEWRPLTLKARIMPADAVDVVELLAELVDGKFVTQFSSCSRSFGAVRNFRQFQRPKKPNAVHVLPEELRTYVGLSELAGEPEEDKPPPVLHQFPTKGEKPSQMKEDRGEDSEANASGAGAPADPVKEIWSRGLAILGQGQRSLLGKLRKTYTDPVVLAAIVSCENECPSEPAAFLVACCERSKTNGRGSAEHDRAVDILGNAGFDYDERQSSRGPAQTPH